MAASRAPVIRARGVGGMSGGIGAGISSLLAGIADRKREERRREDEQIKVEAKIAASHTKGSIEDAWSVAEADGQFHGLSASERVQLRKDIASPFMEAMENTGGDRIEYRSVYADTEFWLAGKIDSDTADQKERERAASFSKYVAATGRRKQQLEIDTQNLEEMFASGNGKVVNGAFEQMNGIREERIFLATQTAPGQKVEKGSIDKIEDEFRVLPMRAVLRRAAESDDPNAYPALKRRIANKSDYTPDGKTRFSGPATPEDKTAAFEEFDTIWEANVRQAEKLETLSEDAAKQRTKDANTSLSKELFRLDADGQPVIPLDVALRIAASTEGYQSGDKGSTSLYTRIKTFHKDLGAADDTAAQDLIENSMVAQVRMSDFRAELAGTINEAQTEALVARMVDYEANGDITKDQLSYIEGQADARRDALNALDQAGDNIAQENRRRLSPLFKGWQIDAGTPTQGGVTFITPQYSDRKAAFYTNAQMMLAPALEQSGLLDSRTIQAVDSFVRAQAETIGDEDKPYHWLTEPDFTTAPAETAGGKTIERLAGMLARAGDMQGLTDAAGFGWIGMHFPHEMRWGEGEAFDEGATSDALEARFLEEGFSVEDAAARTAHVMGYYLKPGLKLIESIRNGRPISLAGTP